LIYAKLCLLIHERHFTYECIRQWGICQARLIGTG
jgi:hypothetical protein